MTDGLHRRSQCANISVHGANREGHARPYTPEIRLLLPPPPCTHSSKSLPVTVCCWQGGDFAKKKTYDVDPESDTFYARQKGALFPAAIEANGTELTAVTQREDDIRR